MTEQTKVRVAVDGPVEAAAEAPLGDLGRRLAARRVNLGLTRRQAAARAGMAVTYLRYLEEHPGAAPGTSALMRLAEALETTASGPPRRATPRRAGPAGRLRPRRRRCAGQALYGRAGPREGWVQQPDGDRQPVHRLKDGLRSPAAGGGEGPRAPLLARRQRGPGSSLRPACAARRGKRSSSAVGSR